jgi:signal transduction histidine kinase
VSTLDCLKLIKSSADQLSLIVSDILELSKLKNSKLTLIKAKSNLNDLVEDVVKVCQTNLNSDQVELFNQCCSAPLLVYQDRDRLQ